MSSSRLTDRFREIIEVNWTEFRDMEQDPELSNFDSAVTSLVRACSKGNLTAIRQALDRIDGPVIQEIEQIMPKFYTLYPNATHAIDGPAEEEPAPTDPEETLPAVLTAEEMPSGSLRAVLDRMLDTKKQTVDVILASAQAIDNNEPTKNDPYVKSVIVAGLMSLVHRGKLAAVLEVFEQIDGKVKQSFKLLGDDVYLTSFAPVAPAGAIKNKDGVYQLENKQVTALWGDKLDAGNRVRR